MVERRTIFDSLMDQFAPSPFFFAVSFGVTIPVISDHVLLGDTTYYRCLKALTHNT
jgi:hypothetical protein